MISEKIQGGGRGINIHNCYNILSEVSRIQQQKKNNETCKETETCVPNIGEKAGKRNTFEGFQMSEISAKTSKQTL